VVVPGAFEGVEVPVFRAEAGVGPENGHLAGDRVEDLRRRGRRVEGVVELPRLPLQPFEVGCGVAGYSPGILEPRLVVVPDDGTSRVRLVAEDLVDPIVLPVGKVPGDEKRRDLLLAGVERKEGAHRAHVVPVLRARVGGGGRLEPAVERKILPEEALGVEPLAAIPASGMGDLGMKGREREGASVRMLRRKLLALHEDAAERVLLDEPIPRTSRLPPGRAVLE